MNAKTDDRSMSGEIALGLRDAKRVSEHAVADRMSEILFEKNVDFYPRNRIDYVLAVRQAEQELKK